MYRHSPLMRSLLSQFRTPTEPRRSVGFFRSGHLAGRPARLITQSTSGQLILLCQPFRPSTKQSYQSNEKSQRKLLVQSLCPKLCINENANNCKEET